MTVAELIEYLKTFNPSLLVVQEDQFGEKVELDWADIYVEEVSKDPHKEVQFTCVAGKVLVIS